MEKRLLIAFVLSALIFVVWTTVVSPPPPPANTELTPTASATAVETPAPETVPTPQPAAEEEAAETPPAEAVEATAEEHLTLENDVLHVEFSNRGAAITSLRLTRYKDDEGRPLELVQDIKDPRRSLPLQLVDDGEPDTRLYTMEKDGDSVHFVWADGRGQRREKTVGIPEKGYGISVNMSVLGGESTPAMSVGTGMRNIGPAEKENRFATWGDAVVGAAKVERYRRQKVDKPITVPGAGLRFVGLEDTYFLNIFRPETPLKEARILPLELPAPAGEEAKDKKKEDRSVLEVLVVPAERTLSGQLFAAPKEYDLLQRVDDGVQDTLHFGIFHPISVLFLKALRWIFSLVGNWGVAIILLTVAIRIVLFPLMHTSTVSMRKMQKLQPKVKAIQEKYKKHKGDPQMRAKMNQEMMELYKVEGVNPMGGCLPMLVQLPILWALYTLFAYAIELRHAPFVFWIHDLSAKDPYYITPILMTATMWLQQRLAPQAGDPQQQKIFRLMPLVFGIMFLGFPAGLVLYWLTNNVLTIAQQEITLHMLGERKRPRAAGRRSK